MSKSVKLDIRVDITPDGVKVLVFSEYSPEHEFKELVKAAVADLAKKHYLGEKA